MSHLDEFRNNSISLEELYTTYLENIEKYNDKFGVLVHIVNEVYNDVKSTTVNVSEKEPLRGVPVVIKDSILTKGIVTTCGAEELREFIPDRDAPSVLEIREAGGIIAAKSNTPKYTLDVQTYNELFGITKNPYDPDKTAGGSSGGSAVAIRLGMTDLALGSDLAGSLRIPAGFCGVTALKPTFGRINTKGHIPPEPKGTFTGYEATIGPMASNVKGLELLFGVLANRPADGYPQIPSIVKPAIDISDLSLIISKQIGDKLVSSAVDRGMNNFIDSVNDAGIDYDLEQPDLNFEEIQEAHDIFYRATMNATEPNKKEPTPHEMANAMETRHSLTRQLENYLGDSIWVLPVSRVQPYDHNLDHNTITQDGKEFSYWNTIDYTLPFSVLGSPVVVIPVGMVDGLPLGVQLVGRKWQDNDLLAAAKTLETIFENQIKDPNL